MITPATKKHIKQLVEVHLSSFKGFFLSFLGKRFLTLYYNLLLKDSNGIAFVCIHDDTVIGFVTGFIDPVNYYKRLLRGHWYKFGFASVPSIIYKPYSILRLVRAVNKPFEIPQENNICELSSIGILPDYQGVGIGSQLLTEFIKEIKKRGVKDIFLTTDTLNNEGINSFYKKRGFKIRKTYETPEGRLLNEFWLNSPN
jgi:ribosomal protein S18 acetylase RimI-like enzyme